MRSLLSFCSLALAVQAGERYEISGQTAPPAPASVYLHGAITPFHASTQTGSKGQFRFRDVAAGTYTLIAFAGAHGESRQTIEVGPSFADSKRRIKVTCALGDRDVRRGNLVSAHELTIPERAWREYSDAQRKLSRHNVAGAVGHLERAVAVAPQFTAAWNHLGTIAYQSREYEKAEAHFRRALAADSDSYEPLVNLGGVLLTLGKIDEALDYNRRAVLARPGDALANSQLGMAYFSAGNFDLARKYLETAKGIDPAHFSHPQLVLAEIHRKRGDGDSASRELDDFVRRHPDSAQATRIRAMRK